MTKQKHKNLIFSILSCMLLVTCKDNYPTPTEHIRQTLGSGILGDVIITPAMQPIVVNRYASLVQNAAINDLSIVVDDVASLNLKKGDLLFIYQTQGAVMSKTNGTTYGSLTDKNGAGTFEYVFVEIVDTAANKIYLSAGTNLEKHAGLQNNYLATGAGTQVIWVPQYNNLTVQPQAVITAPAWNGKTGGIVVINAKETVDLKGKIDVSGRGFRGGVPRILLTPEAGAGKTEYVFTDNRSGGDKGESIAGYQEAYGIQGHFGRGAPVNGGGGGNSQRAGGGGGSNGLLDAGLSSGNGFPDSTWSAEWLLEGGLSASSGGGRGGYSYSTDALDPKAVAPGSFGPSWGGDGRQQVGGLGGWALSSSRASLFLGGGGGAGDTGGVVPGNGITAASGGAGGGLVYLTANFVIGNDQGMIVANGAAGDKGDFGTTYVGAGGAGGGGSVILASTFSSGVSIAAKGGVGGGHKEKYGAFGAGPGGGGGGGYVAVYGNTQIVSDVSGGKAGQISGDTFVDFPVNGATDGAAGHVSNNSTAVICSNTSAIEPACATADLTPSITINPTTLSARIQVKNLGPSPALGVEVDIELGQGITIDSISTTGWDCAHKNAKFNCRLPSLGVGEIPSDITLGLVVAPNVTDVLIKAAVDSATLDLNPKNNNDNAGIAVPTPHQFGATGGGLGCNAGSQPLTNVDYGFGIGLYSMFAAVWLYQRRRQTLVIANEKQNEEIV